jgi:PAS domain S-box-containing protein
MVPQTTSLVFLQYLTTVFDNITDAIVLIGIEKKGFRLLLANNAFFANTGYPPDSIGKLMSEIAVPDVYRFISKQYKKAIKTKQPIEYSYWGEMPRGKRAYTVKAIPVLNTVGEPMQLAVVVRDVTEWTNMQAELERLNTKLDEKKQ